MTWYDDYYVFDDIMMTMYDDYDAWCCYFNMTIFSILSTVYDVNAMLYHVEKSPRTQPYKVWITMLRWITNARVLLILT